VTHHSAATFLFADIAGFTALTEAHGDEEAVQLVEDFAAAVQAELPRVDGKHIKTIGDALMLRIPDPLDAIRLGVWITRAAMGGHQAPSVRVGGNHGSAIERAGDYFGTTINVAARVSALARGGELLVTGATAALAAGLEGVLYESRGRQTLRNIAEPVEIFSVVPLDDGAHQYVVDPVCKMAVDPGRAVGRLMLDEVAFHFCSLSCAAAFAQHPERYTDDRV
jgi:adenylate cyclase